MGLGLRRRAEALARSRPLVRRWWVAALLWRGRRGPRDPFDRAYGVETGAPVPLFLSGTGGAADRHAIPYGGCVPSVVRRTLDALTGLAGASFVDLGCGKGRALVIASEYPFRRVIGVELHAQLAERARAHAAAIARRFPDRPPIAVVTGDASAPALPAGDVVIFLYHPFGAPLVERLRDHLAHVPVTATLHLVYENPVHGAVWDTDPAWRRVSAAMLPCLAEELPFAFDAEEAVVVWRRGGDAAVPEEALRPIRVTKPGYRAVLAR